MPRIDQYLADLPRLFERAAQAGHRQGAPTEDAQAARPGSAKPTHAMQLDILQAAKNLLAAAGSSEAAIKQVQSLQWK